MPIYRDPSIITQSKNRPIFLPTEIIGSAGTVQFFLGASVGATTWISVSPANDDPFERQKAAFLAILPSALAPFSGSWVVSVDGAIRDSDHDLQRLSQRFFAANGDIATYITKVNPRKAAMVRTPFQHGPRNRGL